MSGRAVAFLRHVAGFALTPAVAPVLFFAYDVVRMAAWSARAGSVAAARGPSSLDLVVTATKMVPACYLIATVLGLPIVLALRAARRLTLPWVVGVSASAAGLVVVAAMLVAGTYDPDLRVRLADLGDVAILAGVAAGLAAAVSGAYCAVAGVPLRGPPVVPCA